MSSIDVILVVLYLVLMVGIGWYFSASNRNAQAFSKAEGAIPGWALGLSFYATFLSAITFLGDPGKSFGSNWNPFVFSLSIPFAAIIASRYFVRFYRNSDSISAYSHLEKSMGAWARTYAMLCFILTQLARMGTIFYALALTIHALSDWPMPWIILIAGICIAAYTILGGMAAVIWTEVLQAIIKTLGALMIMYLILQETSLQAIWEQGQAEGKFSLGTFSLDLSQSSFWVVFMYGFFINLTNFGVDQNYIQRYHSAMHAKEAARSIWLCALYYVPVSALFFFIGTGLYVFYGAHPEWILSLKQAVALEKNLDLSQLQPSDYADRVLPFFLKTQIPKGLLGLLIAALLSAAMSTISSGMNSSATVFLHDIYLPYIKPQAGPKQQFRLLLISTAVMGSLGIATGIAMIGVQSLLDVWWKLSGVFAGGMLGLFLMSLLIKNIRKTWAVLSLLAGLLIIAWISLKTLLPPAWQSPFEPKLTIVMGTLTLLFTAWLLHALFPKKHA